MARFRRSRGGGGAGQGNVVMSGLGQIVGLVLGLYVFNEILEVALPYINTSNSVYFSQSGTFITSLLPVLGILGTFFIVWKTLKKAGMA